jgi:flagellar protein FliJ
MFTFRLQRILELREQAEQARARELVSARDDADAARAAHDAIADVHATSRAQTNAAQQTAPRVGHLQQLGIVLQSLDARLEQSGEQVRAADGVVVGAQKVLEDAARDRRILDRLKDRHAEQWSIDAAHKDRLGMDEVALARFTRTADARASDNAATRTRSDDATRESPQHDGSTS